MFENTRMAGGGIVDRVRQNPIPAAMVAIGLGWLFSRAGEGRSDMVGAAQDRLAGVAGQAQAQASQMRETARVQASQARSGFDQLLTDSPLAVGAVALAAGVAIGMAAPSTPKEHELMGQARDRLLDQAQSRAEEAVDKAQQVAHKAVSSAREEARNQGLTS